MRLQCACKTGEGKNMKTVDLRSDTLSMPSKEMLETILTVPLGDDGRLGPDGRGEDATINKLEDMSAAIVEKEAGLFCCSGTMGNQVALFTYCRPGDLVLVDQIQHIYKSEKTAFDPRFGQMIPLTYKFDETCMPDLKDIEEKLKNNKVKLLCVENSHNFTGGSCTNLKRLAEINALAKKYKVKVHMDGARLFNAAIALGVTAKDMCQYVDSVMFCFSKGLAAPIGSILCSSKEFITEAKETRKLFGGALRQGGVAAAPAIYALEHNIPRLAEDNANANYCASLLQTLKKLDIQKKVETNILVLDLKNAGISPKEFCARAEKKGLLIKPVLTTCVRLVFYKGITSEDAAQAAKIIKELDASL